MFKTVAVLFVALASAYTKEQQVSDLAPVLGSYMSAGGVVAQMQEINPDTCDINVRPKIKERLEDIVTAYVDMRDALRNAKPHKKMDAKITEKHEAMISASTKIAMGAKNREEGLCLRRLATILTESLSDEICFYSYQAETEPLSMCKTTGFYKKYPVQKDLSTTEGEEQEADHDTTEN